MTNDENNIMVEQIFSITQYCDNKQTISRVMPLEVRTEKIRVLKQEFSVRYMLHILEGRSKYVILESN